MRSREWECEKLHRLNAAHISINSTAVVEHWGGDSAAKVRCKNAHLICHFNYKFIFTHYCKFLSV